MSARDRRPRVAVEEAALPRGIAVAVTTDGRLVVDRAQLSPAARLWALGLDADNDGPDESRDDGPPLAG